MITNRNQNAPVLLRRRVILTHGLIFDAQREVILPIQPFVGLTLYNATWSPPDSDDSEDRIEEIAYDLKSGRLICYLRRDDYRPESSGSNDWIEDDVIEHYRDWTLQREETR